MARILEYYVSAVDADFREKYLQGIKPNDNYCRSGTAPTMGARHSFCEYKTIWGNRKKYFEPLTLANYIKVIFDENRWETKDVIFFEVRQKGH